MPRRLSKSQYVKGRRCLKRVWLYNYQPELATPPSAVQEGIFEQGKEVGRLARQCFPEGELVQEDHTDPEGALEHTQRLLAQGKKTIFEAALLYDDILVRVDILHAHGDGSFDLIEVKSSTQVKKEHAHDVAVQKYVAEGAGLKIRSASVMHLNKDYVFSGRLDLTQLFVEQEMEELFGEALEELPRYVATIRKSLAEAQPPPSPIGGVCKRGYRCEFYEHCWQGVPADSIHFLYRLSDERRAELVARGIARVQEIPEAFGLKDYQAVQAHAARTQKPVINAGEIRRHLGQLKYPLYFLDFETIGFAIPRYVGTRPYQALPFQFSLHVKKTPEAPLEHFEYLHREDGDPREALTRTLLSQIGERGSVVVYTSFESGVIKKLAEAFPQHRAALENLLARLWDLAEPFAERHYWHPNFYGSYSIKRVLPALIGDLTYDGLEVKAGDQAQVHYLRMIDPETPPPERPGLAKALLEYCQVDTLAMVKVLAHLHANIS